MEATVQFSSLELKSPGVINFYLPDTQFVVIILIDINELYIIHTIEDTEKTVIDSYVLNRININSTHKYTNLNKNESSRRPQKQR